MKEIWGLRSLMPRQSRLLYQWFHVDFLFNQRFCDGSWWKCQGWMLLGWGGIMISMMILKIWKSNKHSVKQISCSIQHEWHWWIGLGLEVQTAKTKLIHASLFPLMFHPIILFLLNEVRFTFGIEYPNSIWMNRFDCWVAVVSLSCTVPIFQ